MRNTFAVRSQRVATPPVLPENALMTADEMAAMDRGEFVEENASALTLRSVGERIK
jgi:hypothetical protein